MFAWLRNAFRFGEGIGNLITGATLKALFNVITQIFSVTYAYWHTVSGHVLNGWQELTRNLLYFKNNLNQFLFSQYLLDALIVKHDIPFLSNWISWLGGKIQHDLGTLRGVLQKEIVAGDNAQHAYSRSIYLFVLLHVLAFLYGLVKSVFGWIDGIGAKMWHYFTHLDEFAKLLFMFLIAVLEDQAWNVGGLLGKFFLSLITKNVVKFATLVETIVDAIL
jgi:hypothetical protein